MKESDGIVDSLVQPAPSPEGTASPADPSLSERASTTGDAADRPSSEHPTEVQTSSDRPSAGLQDTRRFIDQEQIARGGMSTVHRAFDQLLRRAVAMKTLAINDGDAVARFIEEAQITGQLDHPNIVPVYDMEQDALGVPRRLAMKLVQGQTLETYVLEQDPIPASAAALEQTLEIFLKTCDAVAFAHSRGVVHRDLKPANIMVGSHGQVYLMDWGIATLAPEGQPSDSNVPARVQLERLTTESHGTLLGTPAFMAPEQARGLVEGIDERTDTYGLGGILYFILTRCPPHGGNLRQQLHNAKSGRVLPPQQLTPDQPLPPGLCRIAMRALSPNPKDRYASAVDMKNDVQEFLRGGGWLERLQFEKGQVIVAEGTAPGAAYIITEGQCELHKGLGAQRRFIRLMGAGEAFGEMAIFGSTKRTATVIAASRVSTLVVTRSALERELDRRVWLRALVEAMAERYLEMNRKVTRLEQEISELRYSASKNR